MMGQDSIKAEEKISGREEIKIYLTASLHR